MPALEGKIALITGAKGALGSFVTQAFLDAGATVAGVSRSIKDADFASPRFTAFPAELTDSEAARQLADAVAGRFGRIDTLIHVLGGFAGGKSVAETEDTVLDRMLDLNLRSAFYISRAVVPHMRRAGEGRIVAIGSRAAVDPSPMVAAYAASKAGMLALMRALAAENRDLGIGVNVVLPGTMDTPANRAAEPRADYTKWVDPAQVVALVLHLASDSAAQISGAAIPVYGGQL